MTDTTEPTDIEGALSLMIAPVEEQEDNQGEVEATDDAAPDADQTGEAGDDADSLDVADGSGDDDREEPSDENETETDQDAIYPVKIDGKVEMWTLDQLQKSASGQGYINKQMQTTAQAKKEAEAERDALRQERQAVFEAYQRLQSGNGLTPPKPPTADLLKSDPIGYMEQKLEYDEARAEYDKQAAQFNQMQVAQERETAVQRTERLREQAGLVVKRIPEFADPQKAAKLQRDLVRTGMERYGFTEDEMLGFDDGRIVIALYDAHKAQAFEESRRKAEAKATQAGKVIKAGAKRVEDGDAVALKKARERLQRSGSIEDAMALMLKS